MEQSTDGLECTQLATHGFLSAIAFAAISLSFPEVAVATSTLAVGTGFETVVSLLFLLSGSCSVPGFEYILWSDPNGGA